MRQAGGMCESGGMCREEKEKGVRSDTNLCVIVNIIMELVLMGKTYTV